MIKPLIRLSNKTKLNTLAIWFLLGTSILALWAIFLGQYTLATRAKRDETTKTDSMDYYTVHKWQEVRSDNAYVLEAFYDSRGTEAVVRVIGIEKLDNGPRQCLLWYPWRKDPTIVKLTLFPIPEHHGKDYWPFVYTCPINDTKPVAVSLVRGGQRHASNLLTVNNAMLRNKDFQKVDFTVCVAILHREFDNHRQLVEAVEAYEMFGAQKIVIYSYSIGPNVAKILKHYMQLGLIDLIKWTIPVEENEIHYYGQVAAINDCIYRYMYRTTFLVFSDLDEFIVPRTFTTWQATMDKIVSLSLHAKWSGAYVFQNAFFPMDCEDSPAFVNASLIKYYNMVTLLKSVRIGQVWPHLIRSKCIIRPDAVTVSGIHYMWGFTGNYTHYNVSESLAVLHHYRDYMHGCDGWRVDPFMWTEDKSMFRFRRDLTKRIWRTMITVGDCGGSPINGDIPSLVMQRSGHRGIQ